MDRVMYDSHMHTPLCKHAIGFPEDYAEAAWERGLKGIVITCHNPVPDWAPRIRMDLDEYSQYVEWVEVAREEWQGKVDVLLGLESDYAPGMEGYLEELHARVPLNYILGSVHPNLPDYRDRYYQGDVREFRRSYFEHLALAAETGLFHALSHPDLIKNCFADEWSFKDVLDDVRRVLDRIAKTGIAMELNTSGQFKAYSEMNPGSDMLREMNTRGIPVVLGSDAHQPGRVGCSFLPALEVLEEAGYGEVCYFVAGKAKSVSIEDARHSLTHRGDE